MASSTEIIVEVQQLVGRYCNAVLRNDAAIFVDTWQPDAEWCIPGAKSVEGRDAIVATFTEIRSTYPRCVQEILNLEVDVHDDRSASATVQVRELQWRADGSGSELIGVYHDEVVLGDDGRCRFARRDFELLYDGPVSLPGRLRRGR